MPLRMPSPMKRPQSSVFQFRRRIPRDIVEKARGQTISVLVGNRTVQKVIGAKATEISFSLDTRDPREAKAREAAALAQPTPISRQYRRFRSSGRLPRNKKPRIS
ncbi:DUF6538 domain-containing protein [Acuticoccus kalidii]|uniref:DUF6538 domain-containing protein n=1 Tax=Acuticoccus kalidii TaxID=2910977 RepID=UPI0034E2DDF8